MQGVIGNFEDYWELVKDVWQTGVLGHSIGDILVAVAIFGFFYVLRGLFTRFVLAIADRWVERTETKLDDYIRDAVKSPLRFLFLALGFFFATEYLDFGDTAGLITENLNRSLIVIAIFWALYNCVGPVSQGIKKLERVLTPEILDWLIAGAKTAIVLIAIATILQTWGIQVAPIIAGLGLFGVAVALGAQDLFKNLIGGMSILIERRFGFGDWIKVDGVVEGNVERIGFRSTLVRQFDKAPVYVPNQHLSDNAVTNYTAMTYRRISWIIGVEYRTTHEQLQRIVDDIRSYIETTDDFVQPPLAPLFVRIDSFGASSIDIMVYCFTRTTVWGEWLAVKEALAYRIKQIVEGAGTGFAFPSRSIYVETMPPSPEEIVAARKE
ncbi:mechanosensitive ion channel family protein [Parvibaculum sp.]|jgi:MscS family membrane protein|uniref:mechanosensitive ion channel family protein n=1 Tax=Parvibaculum sp. TaxID=2024848 RepID=UPI000C3C14DA|nr:mechanosensitive ion channel family protein [Parvibaculum sp.]HAC60118.1 mechanosensitive ion channel protein MscS [Rhodobiaceae bacterium]MAU62249.1 mechanosensitive ion channel protein MscS [Parvibaculum sp.]MBO6667141.1 mechanosensitive ion channel family protein [Parvibaculum sp.]MBO6693065.1 mechanosensitive ion channel family protein [Parvibaculum sp.]MBO6713694.1 mechanosensitive ion channel family protein [Parvibaculum sp.]|tara:strand:+ start:953 stop:2095 length:1143 start_codon:yes stop_codon:yes gene_type:complete